MTWSVSKIVDHLKLQMKHGKWSELKGKSDEDLEDLVDAAKDAARNHG
jgi:acyl-CoA-binding protein